MPLKVKPWQRLNTCKFKCVEGSVVCFVSGPGRRAKIQEWAACTTDQWWQITSRPSDEKTFPGTWRWGEVAAITTSHILKINTCFHTSSLPEVNSFSRVGHPVADPYFWNVGGQETSVAPRGDWGTELLIQQRITIYIHSFILTTLVKDNLNKRNLTLKLNSSWDITPHI